jgi:FkbM family methyltransferase
LLKLTIPQIKTPLFLRPKSSDILVFNQIFLYEEYQIEIDFEPALIIDAGAYIGLSTVFFATKYPDATVVAIEPVESNLSVLDLNVKPYSNIQVKSAALWYQPDFLQVVDPRVNYFEFQMREAMKNETGTVPSITLNDILEEYSGPGIDILKVDIEGAEKVVFTKNNSWLSKVRIVIVELHECYAPGVTKALDHVMGVHQFVKRSVGENVIYSRS